MVSATTYHDWRFLLRLVQRDAAAVDVLEFLDFVQVHGFGPLNAIYPKIRGRASSTRRPNTLQPGRRSGGGGA